VYNFTVPYEKLNVAEDAPEINSVPNGSMVITSVPEISLTTYIRSPSFLRVGSGRVSVVACATDRATMSSLVVIVYVAVVTTDLTIAGSNVNPPTPSVFRTELEVEAVAGHENDPIWMSPVSDVIDRAPVLDIDSVMISPTMIGIAHDMIVCYIIITRSKTFSFMQALL